MKLTASFEGGAMHLHLSAETRAEQTMLGAVINQPQGEDVCAYMDKSLISASIRYDGHWTNKLISNITMSIYQPNKGTQ